MTEQFGRGNLSRCWRCGVDFIRKGGLIANAPCRDCREALDEINGKTEWFTKVYPKRKAA